MVFNLLNHASIFCLLINYITWSYCSIQLGKCVINVNKFNVNTNACCFSSAVQSERKPIDVVPREKHANCAASTQKIYIRKDLNSPLIATPTFISDTETDGSRSVGIRATDRPQALALCVVLSLSC